VLSQVYLAAIAPDEKAKPQVATALGQINWKEWSVQQPASASRLRERKKQVGEAKWWLRALDADGRWPEFKDKLEREWGKAELPEALLKLLGAIEQGGLLDSTVVADAYCAVAPKLGGKPCATG
jgi:hypothetical protein